jgi:hypothetical protein
LLTSAAVDVALGGGAVEALFRTVFDALSAIRRPDPEVRRSTI